MATPAHALSSVLRQVRRRWFCYEWSRAATWTAMAAAVSVAALAGTAARLRPGPGVVVAMFVAAVALTALAAIRVGWRLRHRPNDARVARFVEERCPELDDRLASGAGLLGRAPLSPLEDLVVAEAARHAANIDVGRVIAPRDLWRRALALSASLTLVVAACVVAREPLRQAWWSLRLVVLPPVLSLAVEPGDVTLVEGQSLRVRAVVLGMPASAWLAPLAVRRMAGEAGDVAPMSRGNGGFESDLGEVREAFTYRVEGGGLISPAFQVTVRRPPRVARIDVEYTYPAFTGMRPRVEEDGGDVFAPAGTRVRLHVHTLEPVRDGLLTITGAPPVTLEAGGPTRLVGELTVSRDAAYRVALTSGQGLSSPGDTEYFVRVMDDRPPEVRILRPAGDQRVTALEEVAFEVRADDDFGIDRLELVVSAKGERERVVPLVSSGTAASVSGRHTLPLEELGVAPGDFVSFYAQARDVGRARRPTTARTDLYFLEVRPFTEEFEAAQSQAFTNGGESFDDLASLQKDVVIATWKLDRRSAAGRSREDVAAVARAQGEVKARAQRLAARPMVPQRPSRRGRPADAPAEPASTPDAMPLAIAAMERAQRALEAGDTPGALPHEMEALNQLLRAQAEVRRRQVARQQAGGGGGGRGGTQDLSALFDRELQRQQQTNYENRATASTTRETTSRDDTLDKLRELARRQDDLARELGTLARRDASLPRDEMRRRLERLSREQQDLEQRAQQLSRRLQAGGQNGQAGSPGSGAQEALREAVEEIGRASRELAQGNTEGAGARGARASDRLREAEKRAGAGAGRGAAPSAGDLQAELQQLAEAQRGLARRAEAQRAGGDALADEQLALAQRATAVDQGARRLAGAGGATDAERRAARGLAQQRLEERMREAARAARDLSARGEAATSAWARGARELADAVERAARGLSGGRAADDEAMRLAGSLARVREAREALARAESELRRHLVEAGVPADGARSGAMPGEGADAARLASAQQEYARRLAEAQRAVEEASRGMAGRGEGLATPEGWAPSSSAPGTEAFKQDFARWNELRRGATLALERAEATLAAQLAARRSRDRLNADLDDRVPDAYRRQVSRYYEALSQQDRP